jgi:hypothetical protein
VTQIYYTPGECHVLVFYIIVVGPDVGVNHCEVYRRLWSGTEAQSGPILPEQYLGPAQIEIRSSSHLSQQP